MKRKLEMKDSQEQRLHYHDFWIEVLIRFWKYSNTYFRWTLIEWDWPAWNLPRTPILIQLPFGKLLSTCQTSAFLDIKKHRSCRRAMPSQATFWAFAKCQLSSLHTGISSICYCTAAPCTCLANFPLCFILQFLMSLGQLLWVGGRMMWRYNPLCPWLRAWAVHTPSLLLHNTIATMIGQSFTQKFCQGVRKPMS